MAQSCLTVMMAQTHSFAFGRMEGWIWYIGGLVILQAASLLGLCSLLFVPHLLIQTSQHFAATSSGLVPGNCTKSSQPGSGEVDFSCKSTSDWWPESTMFKPS